MNRSVKVVVTTALTFFLASMALNLFLLLYGISQARAQPFGEALSELALIREALGNVRTWFVTEKQTDLRELVYGAIDGVVRSLDDPYSRFMRPQKFKSMETATKGSFGGLGIIIGEKDKRVTVITPIKGSPAFKVGIHAGDFIVKVDGKSTEGKALEDVVDQLRGKIGTTVHVTMYREGERRLLEFDIVREEIQLPSIKYCLGAGDVGYVNISNFIQTTGDTLDEIVTKLEQEGMRSLILDLRGNPGGLLEAAVRVSRVFLGADTIVTVKSRAADTVAYRSFRESHRKFPLIVLIDRGSASASEIVAGAIKDNRRGVLLGEKTFGKGCVQTVLKLSDGSALAITTAYYYTPSGVCIHKKGIRPDIPVDQEPLTPEQVSEYRKAMQAAYDDSIKAGSVEGGSAQTLQPREFETMLSYDTQLQTAMDVLGSAPVAAMLWNQDGGAPDGRR